MQFDSNNWINLVLLKILRFGQVIGQKIPKNPNYSIYGHTFFGHNSAIFWPIGLKFFVGTNETIIYWLLVRNQCYTAQFLISNFWALIGGEKGLGHLLTTPQLPGKVLKQCITCINVYTWINIQIIDPQTIFFYMHVFKIVFKMF